MRKPNFDEALKKISRLEALVEKLLEHMEATPIEQPCAKCGGEGPWRNCATCSGAGVTFVFTRRLM